MKRSVVFGILISVILIGCVTGKKLAENNTIAKSFFDSGNYGEAVSVYKLIIQDYEVNNNSKICPVYTNAGISALQTGETKLGIDYLKKATYTRFVSDTTYFNLADGYEIIDNLSLEMLALEDILSKYPQSEYTAEVKKRLFSIYVQSTNYEKALKIWGNKTIDSITDVGILETYFTLNKGLKDDNHCDISASRILVLDPENISALNYFGKKYYRKAEDVYQEEMKAYNNNKTNKQYKILLKALDQVTVDFKKSLEYFEKLYEVDPTQQTANYLSHIYNRLSDDKKADYYKKLSEK